MDTVIGSSGQNADSNAVGPGWPEILLSGDAFDMKTRLLKSESLGYEFLDSYLCYRRIMIFLTPKS